MFYDDFQIDISTDVAMATAQIKGAKTKFPKTFFLNSDFRNGIRKYQLAALPIFAMFHPQTTEMQPYLMTSLH